MRAYHAGQQGMAQSSKETGSEWLWGKKKDVLICICLHSASFHKRLEAACFKQNMQYKEILMKKKKRLQMPWPRRLIENLKNS